MGKWSRARAVQQVTDWFGSIPDFIITLDADYCRQCGDTEFIALLDHLMYPAAQDAMPSAPRNLARAQVCQCSPYGDMT
jgi:hypothetical protein